MTGEQVAFYSEQFDRCWPWLAEAVDSYGRTHGKDDVWREIEAGDAQFWPFPSSAIVTNINKYPTGLKEFRFWLAGGDLDELQAAEPHLAAYAKGLGCQSITICGRRGWVRSLPGYREAATLMSKDL